jgi:hypothetical protein
MKRENQMNFVLDKETMEGLKELAWRKRMSMSELCRQLITSALCSEGINTQAKDE